MKLITKNMTEKKELLDFPTAFVIKVFGPNSQEFIDEINQLTHASCENSDKPTFSYHLSKNNKYVSISVSVYVTSKPNLDKIYQVLTSHPQVKMVI